MFKKLYFKIYLPIYLLTICLIVFFNVFSITMSEKTLLEAYHGIDQKRISRTLDSCELYISSVSSSVNNLSIDKDLINELAISNNYALINKLDKVCNYSLKINAVCAYSKSGRVYNSSNVAGVPSLSELMEVSDINEFILSDLDNMISFRVTNIADVYNNTSYPENMGVITYCKKVYNNDEVVGWIFADILPYNLYNYLFSDEQFSNCIAYLSSNDIKFDFFTQDGSIDASKLDEAKYFKYTAGSDDELFTLTVYNDKTNFTNRLSIISGVIIFISLILMVLSFFVCRKIALSVTNKLDNLVKKMESQSVM